MSRYSFIDETINISGKQCFCIDVNSTNSPFVTIGVDGTRQPQNVLPNTAPMPVSVSMPIQENNLHSLIKHENAPISNDQNYLLTPQVINVPLREQKIIDTANTLLNQAYQSVSSSTQQVQPSNEPIINLPKSSLTVDMDPKLISKIDLNTMANDTKVGKKTLRKSSDSLSLFEGFDSGECTDVCKPKLNRRRKHNRFSEGFSDNFYLLVIIILLLAISWCMK